jgi:hypothetical protein
MSRFLPTRTLYHFRGGKRCPSTVKFGWIGNGDEMAVAWREDDGDDDSEDVGARASSCSVNPFGKAQEIRNAKSWRLHRNDANLCAVCRRLKSTSLTKLRQPVLWINKLGGWPRGWKYSAISLCNLIFSSCATPSPR